MKPFIQHQGLVAVLNRANVDTDQIIPKQFLKRIERTGYGDVLFFDWRYDSAGNLNTSFSLNAPGYAGASVLLAGRNFGSGSSREHAPWALADYGFRCIIASSFGEIFQSNCFQNGILPIVIAEDLVQLLMRRALPGLGYKLRIDLGTQMIEDSQGLKERFATDPFRRHCLLNGLDDIGLTLQEMDTILAYEDDRWPGRFTKDVNHPGSPIAE